MVAFAKIDPYFRNVFLRELSCENKPIFTCGSVKKHACKKSSRPLSVLENLPNHSTLSCFLLHSLSLPHSCPPALPLLSSLSQPSLSPSLSQRRWRRSGGSGEVQQWWRCRLSEPLRLPCGSTVGWPQERWIRRQPC